MRVLAELNPLYLANKLPPIARSKLNELCKHDGNIVGAEKTSVNGKPALVHKATG